MNMSNFFGWATSLEILPIHRAEAPTLVSLGHMEIAQIGRMFLMELSRTSQLIERSPFGLLNIPVNGLSQLMNAVPGLRTLDAEAMNATDISRLAEYVRMKNPEAFEDVLADLAEEWPDAAMALQAVGDAVSGQR